MKRLATVIASVNAGQLAAYTKGGGHKTLWAVRLNCSHTQMATTRDGKPPTRLKCRLCARPSGWFENDQATRANNILADAEHKHGIAALVGDP